MVLTIEIIIALSKPWLRVKSGSIVICGIIVALDNFERVGRAICKR